MQTQTTLMPQLEFTGKQMSRQRLVLKMFTIDKGHLSQQHGKEREAGLNQQAQSARWKC